MRQKLIDRIERRLRILDRRMLLRPMTAGEQIDLSFGVLRAVGLPLFKAVLMPVLWTYGVLAYIQTFLIPRLFTTRAGAELNEEIGSVLVAGAITLFACLPLIVIMIAYASGSATTLTLQYLLEMEINPREATRKVNSRVLPLALSTLYAFSWGLLPAVLGVVLLLLSAISNDPGLAAAAIGAFLGLLALGMWGVVFPMVASRAALAPAILINEPGGAWQAIKRSAQLMKKGPGHPSGYEVFTSLWALMFLVALIVSIGIGGVISLLELPTLIRANIASNFWTEVLSSVVEMLPGFLVLWIVIPVWSVMCTVVYLDRKIRLEGYDIELLAKDAKLLDRKSTGLR